MGSSPSQPLPPPPPNFPYFTLTFQPSDKIELIDCDQQTLQLIQDVIAANWSAGVASQDQTINGFVIKFRKWPFITNERDEYAMAMKKLCCVLLTTLYSFGWKLRVNSNLSRSIGHRTTWFFKRNSSLIGKQLPADGSIFCLSLIDSDKPMFVNAPNYLHNEFAQGVGPILQKEFGKPWISSTYKEEITSRQLLLDVFRRLDYYKYRYYGRANLSGVTDTIFFQQDLSYTGGETRFCTLILSDLDRIRLIDCPKEVVEMVRGCIEQHWPKGIQDTQYRDSCVEYKLRGYPWIPQNFGEDAITSRFFVTVTLQSLLSVGWTVVSALDISRLAKDKTVFVLRNCTPALIRHLCIDPCDADSIRLINAPKDVHNAIANVINANWPKGVQNEGTQLMAYEWKLKGYPWSSNDCAMSRYMMTRLLEVMERLGWRVVCSADVTSNVHDDSKNELDVQSWFLSNTPHAIQDRNVAGTSFTPAFSTPPPPYSERSASSPP